MAINGSVWDKLYSLSLANGGRAAPRMEVSGILGPGVKYVLSKHSLLRSLYSAVRSS